WSRACSRSSCWPRCLGGCSPASPTANASSNRPGRARLNPVTKLVAAAGGMALALAWGGWVAAAVVVVSALAAVRAGRLRRVAVAALALLPVALSSLAINALLPAGGGGVAAALEALLRLLGATLPPTVLFATTDAADLLSELEARGLGW